MAKAIVVGLDGVTWKSLQPWIDSGELPNIKKLVEEGSSGVLKSVVPPLTCPAWKCYSTGKNAGKFGVFARTELDFGKGEIRVADSSFYKSKEIWDLVGEAGMKSAVIDMPTTYPPRKINGFMISSIEPPRYDNYTYPRELQKDLEEKFGYKPDIEGTLYEESEDLEKEYAGLIESRFEIAKHFLGKIDFIHMTIVFTDYLQHFFWRQDFSLKVFKRIDRCIGELVEAAGEDCFFVLMSDHGFWEMRARFFANTWLQSIGLQKTREAVSNALLGIGINKDRLVKALKVLRADGLVRKAVPKKVASQVKSGHGLVSGMDKAELFDWENSKVICHSNDLFYINAQGEEREKIKKELKEKLVGLESPQGEKIIDRVFERDEIYFGDYVGKAPDLVVQAKPWCEVNSALGAKQWFEGESSWKGIHQGEGVFVIKGMRVKKGFKAGKKSLLDLAPTVLKALNVKIPNDLDGKAMEDIFE
jgi:predicted AlkP superfamily phosphohydrolase/phosphomutase